MFLSVHHRFEVNVTQIILYVAAVYVFPHILNQLHKSANNLDKIWQGQLSQV